MCASPTLARSLKWAGRTFGGERGGGRFSERGRDPDLHTKAPLLAKEQPQHCSAVPSLSYPPQQQSCQLNPISREAKVSLWMCENGTEHGGGTRTDSSV